MPIKIHIHKIDGINKYYINIGGIVTVFSKLNGAKRYLMRHGYTKGSKGYYITTLSDSEKELKYLLRSNNCTEKDMTKVIV